MLEKVFVLKFLQSRNPDWQERVFFAQYSETAIWMDDLKPAFGEKRFFFEQEIEEMEEASLHGKLSLTHTHTLSLSHTRALSLCL